MSITEMTLRRTFQLTVIAVLLVAGPVLLVLGAKGFAHGKEVEVSIPQDDAPRICAPSVTEILGLDVAANKMLCFGAACAGLFLTCYAMFLLFPEHSET